MGMITQLYQETTMSFFKLSASTLAIAALSTTTAAARDQVQIAGSSTVLPYASIVAEAFGENFDFPTPVVESGGSSAGLKRFCEGVGENAIDIANASRQIKGSEREACAANGVTDIIEVRIGYDGIVFASDIAGKSFEFTPVDWYKALSETLILDGVAVPNPYTMWNEVNPAFPAQPIQAYVPGTKHGTREVFEDKVILAGCEETGDYDVLKASLGDDKKGRRESLHRVADRRQIGRYRWRLHRNSGPDRKQQRRHRRLWSGVLRKQH